MSSLSIRAMNHTSRRLEAEKRTFWDQYFQMGEIKDQLVARMGEGQYTAWSTKAIDPDRDSLGKIVAIMQAKLNQIDHCKHTKTVLDRTGSIQLIAGDLVDTTADYLYCLDCGCELVVPTIGPHRELVPPAGVEFPTF